MTAILAFLKLVPLRTWLVLAGIFVTAGVVMIYNSHEREIGRQQSQAQLTALQSQLDAATQANASNDAAIKTLQASLAECERGRVADLNAQQEAQKAYAKAVEAFKAGDAAQRAKTAALLKTTCKDWAAQPACGVAPL